MTSKRVTADDLQNFYKYLIREEKSNITIDKYMRDTKKFATFAAGRFITKEIIMEYKKYLLEKNLAVCSINSMLASVNCLLRFLGMEYCKVKNLRIQHRVYCDEDKELTKKEYLQLLKAAEDNSRMELLLQTICGTGIRISELVYFTVETVRKGEVIVSCKNKTRTILIPSKLRTNLLKYARQNKIRNGIIFRTKNGNPMNRSNIWREMKKLCQKAGVKMKKVFPHNLRKLFAKTFYNMEKDIAKLADILGHSSINTTRIYIMTSGAEHMRKINRMGLVFDSVAQESEKKRTT